MTSRFLPACACLALAVPLASCGKKPEPSPTAAEEQVAAPPSEPAAAPEAAALAASPSKPASSKSQAALEKAYLAAVAKDLEAHPELKNLRAIQERYRQREAAGLPAYHSRIREWIAAAPADPERARRRDLANRTVHLCEAMAGLRCAMDPSLTKLIVADPLEARLSVSSELQNLKLDPGQLSDPAADADAALHTAFDQVSNALRELAPPQREATPLLPEFIDLQTDSSIGHRLSLAGDKRSSPATKAVGDEWRASFPVDTFPAH